MEPERWQQMDKLFQAAVELEPERRAAFLDQACGGDQALRGKVEAMLASDNDGWTLIERPALEAAASFLADDRPRLIPNQKIGHYEIVSLIGRGGMGEVYLAKDEVLNRRIALKLLRADYTRDKDRLRRFEQEARAASALNHPNIFTIHELGLVDGQQFIATEFVDGETLRRRMKRGTLTLREALDVAVQTASALAAAHQAGIVHRDIKPENIMLRPDGYVKVLDFGLAKLTEQHERTDKAQLADNLDTSSGLLLGTVNYMSPEQARGLPVDPRSDIFSLGVVLYEMVTGQAPFKGEDASALIKSILRDEPPLAECSGAPEDLQRIVSRVLTKNRGERYQTAEALLVDLKALWHQIDLGTGLQGVAVLGQGSRRNEQPAKRQTEGGEAVSTILMEAEATANIEHVVRLMSRHRTATALGLIGLVVVLAGVAYPLKKLLSKRAAPFERTQITRLTRSGEIRGNAAISPDGKYVAYSLRTAGQRSLWIRELATNKDLQIIPPTDAGFNYLVFAPDSKYLYYLLFPSIVSGVPAGQIALYRTAVSGGTPERLVEDFRSMIAFSPDGRQFAFIRNDPSQGLGTLVIVNADGKGERTVATRKAPNNFSNGPLSWSPDGKSIVCAAINANDGYQRLFEVNIETAAQKPLTSYKWDAIGNVVWLPDSSALLLTAASSPGQFEIWCLSYPRGELRRITNDTNSYGWLSLTADSSSLITTQWEFIREIWTAQEGDASRAKRISLGRLDGVYGLAWTRDGRIVYTTTTDIGIMNGDGTNQKQLTKDSNNDGWPSVTPDGSYIVFQSNRTGVDQIWRMDIDGGNLKQLTFGARDGNPNCSLDSKWVVFNAWESGKAAVWKVPIEGGSPERITDVACLRPSVSPDGSLIACASDKTSPSQWLIIPFAAGKPVKALDVPSGVGGWAIWTSDSKALTYFDTRNAVTNIWSQPIDGSPPKQLTNFKSDQKAASYEIGPYAWSPDGKQLAFTRIESRADVVLIRDLR